MSPLMMRPVVYLAVFLLCSQYASLVNGDDPLVRLSNGLQEGRWFLGKWTRIEEEKMSPNRSQFHVWGPSVNAVQRGDAIVITYRTKVLDDLSTDWREVIRWDKEKEKVVGEFRSEWGTGGSHSVVGKGEYVLTKIEDKHQWVGEGVYDDGRGRNSKIKFTITRQSEDEFEFSRNLKKGKLNIRFQRIAKQEERSLDDR